MATANGIRPVDTQKSTVAGPSPWRFGARSVPEASAPWQLEQFNSNRVCPGAMYELGGRWYVTVLLAARVAEFKAAFVSDVAAGAVVVGAVADGVVVGGVAAWDTDAPDVSNPTTATPATSSPGNR